MAVIVEIFETATQEIDFIVPPSLLSVAGTSFDTMQSAKRFIEDGGVLRGITTITPTNAEEMQMRLDIGEDLRHSDLHYETFMFVGDRQQSFSAINVGIQEYTRDTPVSAFWCNHPSYAAYLLASFERAWAEAVPVEARIAELLAQAGGQG